MELVESVQVTRVSHALLEHLAVPSVSNPSVEWDGTGLLEGLKVYNGEVPDDVPRARDSMGALDPSGRIAPYVVVYVSPGAPVAEQADLGRCNVDATVTVQLTAVAGWQDDVLHLADRVRAVLHRWRPTIPGYVGGFIAPPAGFDPGTVRRDDTVTPSRFWLPLQYQVTVTR